MKKISNFKIILLLAIMFVSSITILYAEEPIYRETSFEMKQDYDACSFDISVENKGNYSVEMYHDRDKNNVYSGMIEDGTSCTINIEGVQKGKWNIKVSVINSADVQTSDGGDEQIPNISEKNPEDVIGKISVSAKAIDKTAFSVGNVQVARDIVGLQEYFKDDSIVVEWTDTSCGRVNITVIDTNTSQILDKKTVEGQYYEFEIPELTDEIAVNIVPSTSANISGANSQFTMAVVNNPDAEIIYEDKEYTNQETIPVNVVLNKPYSLLFISNGTEVESTDILSAGKYTYNVPVSEGSNDIITYVIDDKHNMRSTKYSVIRDSIKPALTLDMEYDGAATYDEIAVITGTIKDYVDFKINETVPVVAGDGSFRCDYRLKDGENVLNIKAVDIAGNETLYVANVTKLIKEEPDISDYLPKIIIGLLIIIFLVLLFIKKNRDKNNDSNMSNNNETNEKKKFKLPTIEIRNKKFVLATWQKDILEVILISVVSYLLFTHVLLFGTVPSSSMEPTLMVGDVAVVNGLAYKGNNSTPQRGDIIVFERSKGGKNDTLIKRVVGIPGDSLMFIDGYLYINGVLVYEEYIESDVETNCAKDFEDIPEGCYFVMGDNRENSNDSRFWEDPYVRSADIKGKMITKIPVSQLKNTISSLLK